MHFITCRVSLAIMQHIIYRAEIDPLSAPAILQYGQNLSTSRRAKQTGHQFENVIWLLLSTGLIPTYQSMTRMTCFLFASVAALTGLFGGMPMIFAASTTTIGT